MARITVKDIKAFGKVLGAVAKLCQANPQRVVELLATAEDSGGPAPTAATADESNYAELEKMNIFEIAKGKTRTELLPVFLQYDVGQLRYLIRLHRFGAIKSKAKNSLAEHLVDQVLKRGVDVFKTHE